MLINQILLVCFSIFLYEFIKYVNLFNIIKTKKNIYQKIYNLFKYKKASDFRKEKLILYYSKSLFIASIKLILIAILLLLIVYVLSLLSIFFFDLIISILGAVELTLIIIIYHLLREKISAKL